MLRQRVTGREVFEPTTLHHRHVEDGEVGTVVLETLPLGRLPDTDEILGGGQARVARHGQAPELYRAGTMLSGVLAKHEKWRNASARLLVSVYAIEGMAQQRITTLSGVVELIPGPLVVTVIGKEARTRVQGVGPVRIMPRCVQYDPIPFLAA